MVTLLVLLPVRLIPRTDLLIRIRVPILTCTAVVGRSVGLVWTFALGHHANAELFGACVRSKGGTGSLRELT